MMKHVVAAALFTTVPAAAQGVFDMGVLTNTMSIPTRPGASRSTLPPRRAYTSAETAIGAVPRAFDRLPSQATPSAGLAYTSTPALRRRAVDGYIARVEREYPEAARVVSAQLAQHDYAKIYSGLMQGAGLRDDDAVDVVAAYTLLGWQIANRNADTISTRQVMAVRSQIARALASDQRFSSPAARADLGEEMKLLFVTLHAGWQSATKEGNTKTYSDGIARMWQRQSGRDLRDIQLTAAGFAPRI